jgi:hypothetical protein
MEKNTLYDLYLSEGCDTLPDLSHLAQQVPAITYSVFQEWIVKDLVDGLGFLHLDLTKAVAKDLLSCLQAAGASGAVVKATYRQPKLTFAEAYLIADCALEELQAKYFPDHTFKPVTYYGERHETWTFVSASQQLIAQGYIPGALFADVDKIDGHVWQQEEYLQADK